MDKNTVLSLSSDQAILTSRQIALRNGGMKVISVMNPVEARFEIEMGRCGVFLVCYRLSKAAVDDLTMLFRKACPQGLIIFVTQAHGDNWVPAQADIAVPESSGPQKILEAMKPHVDKVSSVEQPGDTSQGRSGEVR